MANPGIPRRDKYGMSDALFPFGSIVDAENPDELMRIEARMGRLFIIVWGMFGRLMPFPYPVDSKVTGKPGTDD